MAKSEEAKAKWLSKYASEIGRRLSKCESRPTWQQYPAGHMYMGQGLTPKKAAARYLKGTKYGKQRCARK